jgi:hypothetical protein
LEAKIKSTELFTAILPRRTTDHKTKSVLLKLICFLTYIFI